MKKLLILAAFIIVSSNLCYSQDNAAYKTAVQKMMVASGSEASYKTAINQMLTMMKQQRKDIPTEFWDKMTEELLKSSIIDLTDMLVPIYQKHLTLDDIQKIIAFYESPVGKKYASKIPMITQESMEAGQVWGMKIGEKIMEKLKEKY